MDEINNNGVDLWIGLGKIIIGQKSEIFWTDAISDINLVLRIKSFLQWEELASSL